jgi:hypothetical protein
VLLEKNVLVYVSSPDARGFSQHPLHLYNAGDVVSYTPAKEKPGRMDYF